MRVTKTGATALELPVTLKDVKDHLRVTHDSEDSILTAYLMAAYTWAEEYTRRAIAIQEFLITADGFPYGCWDLPLGRVQSVVKIEYLDTDGNLQLWDPANYEVDLDTDYKARIRPAALASWPSTGDYLSAAKVTITAGWSDVDMPYTVQQAILLKVAELDSARDVTDPEPAALAGAAQIMLANWTLPLWGY